MDPVPNTFTGARGVVGAKAPGQPAFVPHRDLALAMPLLFKNAAILCNLTFQDDKEKLYILDSLFCTYVHIYGDIRNGEFGNLQALQQVFEFVEENGEKGQEVFAAFNSMFMVSMFTFIFGSKSMAAASPTGLDDACYTANAFNSLLALAGDDLKNEMIMKLGNVMGTFKMFDMTQFQKTSKNYIDQVKADQKERYAIDEENKSKV